jgi:transposase
MHSYSQDLRDRVLTALERGEGPTAISRRLEVSRNWVYQVQRAWYGSGRRQSLPVGGYRKPRLAPLEAVIRGWISDEPDMTLAELGTRLSENYGITLTLPALWYQLDRWGLSYKKNAARKRARSARRAASQTGLGSQLSSPQRQEAGVSR